MAFGAQQGPQVGDRRPGQSTDGVVEGKLVLSAEPRSNFGIKKGLTWLNAVNDQVSGIGAQVVPGTLRDSLHILDVLLNLDAGPKPDLIATDEASYSDMVFGVFAILGYRFSPRIADIGDTRYWRAGWPDPGGDYGPLNAIARNRVNLAKIVEVWPDMLRVAGSLITHQVRGYDVLAMLGRDGRPTPLGQGFIEYGRIAKTLHLLAMVDPVDDTHRRAVNTQTTVQESRHPAGPQDLPRLPRGPGRPAGGVGHRAQRRHAVEHPLSRRRRTRTPPAR
jgi:TnpA family transposase